MTTATGPGSAPAAAEKIDGSRAQAHETKTAPVSSPAVERTIIGAIVIGLMLYTFAMCRNYQNIPDVESATNAAPLNSERGQAHAEMLEPASVPRS